MSSRAMRVDARVTRSTYSHPPRKASIPMPVASYANPFTSQRVPPLPPARRATLEAEYDRFREGLPPDLRAHCLEAYGVDLAGRYAGFSIRCPFGKASGQLSLNARQVRRD